jgi:sec-independent protein translocase protein TatC
MSSKLRSTPPVAPPRQQPPPPEPEDGESAHMSLLGHLKELRDRIVKAVIALLIGTIAGFVLTPEVLRILISPYGHTLNTLAPTDGIVAYLRVSLLIGAVLSIPLTTYQFLMFILPGLTRRERRILIGSLPAITILFLIGVSFAWFVMMPPAISILAGFAPEFFQAEWTADRYLSFVTALLFWMGVAFQTPLIFFVLSVIGFLEPGPLLRHWRAAIVGAATAAAFITPTVDPVNMLLVMAPLLVLYALSIVLVAFGSRRFRRRMAFEASSSA